jgi:peptidyl-prolyl cis-trans isomerase C
MNEQERQAALTKAAEAHSKVMAGETFADVAKTLSEDKISAQKGGDLGWVNEGAISKTFSEKVFAMAAGDISEPFVTDYGFHVVQMIEAPQDVIKPLEALKGDIRYQLRHESKKAETQRLLDSVEYKSEG